MIAITANVFVTLPPDNVALIYVTLISRRRATGILENDNDGDVW